MNKSKDRILFSALAIIFILAACVPAQPQPPTQDPGEVANQIATSVALTVAAQNTQTEAARPTDTPSPTPTEVPPATLAVIPTVTSVVVVPPTVASGGGGGGTASTENMTVTPFAVDHSIIPSSARAILLILSGPS